MMEGAAPVPADDAGATPGAENAGAENAGTAFLASGVEPEIVEGVPDIFAEASESNDFSAEF